MSPRRPVPDLELRSRVPADSDGSTLLDYLLRRFRYQDRATWLREIGEGRLTIDGKVLAADARLTGGARLSYRRAHVEPEVDDRLVVVHDDPAVLVVQKPAHLPMHADGPFIRHTLIHLLQTRLAAPELQLVHRLDRETSGLCVLARSAAARDQLRRQFDAGTVQKAYLAVVRGRAAADFTVDLAIGRSPSSAISLRRCAAADAIEAQPARTTVEVLRRGVRHSLLRCTPHSGRTHQIRVHLEAVGLPVLGDKLYGRPDADYLAFVARVKAGEAATRTVDGSPGRQLLHAAALAFDHPTSGARMQFTAAMPADFEPWIDD
ncbi:MAG: RluA family pseudouridine synthase [Planctomycetes bacterium]|nr:RluA family pseudouridine synthase [Planctomycetota bacterium]